jgi:tungstate transport system ATP-binding protein
MISTQHNELYALERITQRYGARTVLAVEALTIGEGETLALIGPSGAGKSTLLRLLCLLERPSDGALRYAGRIVTRDPPLGLQREITLVFQRPLLLDASVRRNIGYGLRLRGRRDERLVDQLIARLGLEQVAQARARTLSGGEMQRVALARAIVLRPRVLLLDEPTANLDPQNVALIEAAIDELHREHGSTIVLATHNVHQARRLTTRTAMLLDGRLIEAGPTARLLHPEGTQATERQTRAFINGAMVY